MMKKLILLFVVVMLLVSGVGFAGEADIQSYCEKSSTSSSGKSYTLMEFCIKKQLKAKANIEKMTIPADIQSYCEKSSTSSSGKSYTLMEFCIKKQLKAKGRLEGAKKKKSN